MQPKIRNLTVRDVQEQAWNVINKFIVWFSYSFGFWFVFVCLLYFWSFSSTEAVKSEIRYLTVRHSQKYKKQQTWKDKNIFTAWCSYIKSHFMYENPFLSFIIIQIQRCNYHILSCSPLFFCSGAFFTRLHWQIPVMKMVTLWYYTLVIATTYRECSSNKDEEYYLHIIIWSVMNDFSWITWKERLHIDTYESGKPTHNTTLSGKIMVLTLTLFVLIQEILL